MKSVNGKRSRRLVQVKNIRRMMGQKGSLRQPLFRSFWIASLISNLGTWIHEVGAGWLMKSRSGSANGLSGPYRDFGTDGFSGNPGGRVG